MSTTAREDNEFIKAVISGDLLMSAIEWIAGNLEPEDVFPDKDLKDWANETGIKHIFSKDDIEEWAADNGYELTPST